MGGGDDGLYGLVADRLGLPEVRLGSSWPGLVERGLVTRDVLGDWLALLAGPGLLGAPTAWVSARWSGE